MESLVSSLVWRDLVTAVFWLAVATLAVGTARRAARHAQRLALALTEC